MRLAQSLIAGLLLFALAACGGGGADFEADFATANANVETLEGRAFDHMLEQRFMAPALSARAVDCMKKHASDREYYRGVMEFEKGGGYQVRFEVDDDLAQCLAGAYEGQQVPEPPTRPYLVPMEIGEKTK